MASSVKSALEVNTPTVSKKWCCTESKIERCSYMWTINNLRYCISDQVKSLNSKGFSIGANKTLCQLRFGEETINKQKTYRLYVYVNSSEEKSKAKFKISIENSKQKEIVSEPEEVFAVEQNKRSKFGYTIGEKFLINNKLPEGRVTIFCEIILFEGCVNNSSESNVNVSECKLSEDLSKLLEDEKFTDVTLIADEHKFRVHKSILAARSAVFAAMFKHDFEELKLNCVEITDIDHATMREMLHFIYTDKLSNLNEKAKDLFTAADKYALEDLKIICENELSVKLSVETAAETLILADRHSAKQLRAYTFAFINAHAIAVIQTPEWQKMIKTHAHLISEAFQAFASKRT